MRCSEAGRKKKPGTSDSQNGNMSKDGVGHLSREPLTSLASLAAWYDIMTMLDTSQHDTPHVYIRKKKQQLSRGEKSMTHSHPSWVVLIPKLNRDSHTAQNTEEQGIYVTLKYYKSINGKLDISSSATQYCISSQLNDKPREKKREIPTGSMDV